MSDTGQQTATKEVTITRVFDAPRERVFAAWTEPQQVTQWWGPRGFTSQVREWEARRNGPIHLYMIGPDGAVSPMTGTFREVMPPQRLSFVSGAFPDAQGEPQLEDMTTVDLAEEAGGKTRLTVHAHITKTTPALAAAVAGMEQGWQETIDRLGEHLAGKKPT